VCPELSDDQFLSWVQELEYEIDEMTSQLPSQRSFILPGGCRSAALSHVCRTVCRRAERVLVSLQNEANVDKGILPYLNRLSDYLYVLALKLNNINNVDEKKWQNICK
jgi:cob(I)alamin adenosyltransferase